MPIVTLDEIQAQSETTWSTAEAARAASLYAGVIGWIHDKAPCLVVDGADAHKLAQANLVIAEALLRAIGSGTGREASESIGPSSVSYVDRAAKPTLTRGDEATLMALCPATARKRFGTIRTRPGY